jgi:hypothetical protein
MFLILWNVLGCILLISTLFILISLIWESKPDEQVKLPFDSRKSLHEERRY